MSDREAILGRIRAAVKTEAPKLFEAHGHTATAEPEESGELREWLPPVPSDLEGQLGLFAEISAKLQTDFRRIPDEAALISAAAELIRASETSLVACHSHPLVEKALADDQTPRLDTAGMSEASEMEPARIGFSACDAMVAQTGSLLVSSRTCGGRALSVLPPHHVVIATTDQMVPDLTEAYALVRKRYDGDLPSMLSFITGPSRTGDIERILVLGAHGPKKLTVLCLEQG